MAQFQQQLPAMQQGEPTQPVQQDMSVILVTAGCEFNMDELLLSIPTLTPDLHNFYCYG